jgi:hypothetical protein
MNTWNSAINILSAKIHIDLILEEYVADHAQHIRFVYRFRSSRDKEKNKFIAFIWSVKLS